MTDWQSRPLDPVYAAPASGHEMIPVCGQLAPGVGSVEFPACGHEISWRAACPDRRVACRVALGE